MSVAVDRGLVDCTPAASVVARRRAKVKGRVALVEVSPADAPARLIVRVADGTGAVDAIFLGRRTIPGIHPGVTVSIEGLVALDHGSPVIFNPAYELGAE